MLKPTRMDRSWNILSGVDFAVYEEVVPPGVYASRLPIDDNGIIRDLEVLIQAWLFGLLHEVFGELASASDFIDKRDDASPPFITTARLPEIADRWIAANQEGGDEDERRALLEHLATSITAVHTLVFRSSQRTKGIEKTIWTAASICETLEYVVLETLDKGTRSLNTMWGACYDSDEVGVAMKKNGWCPADVVRWRSASGGFQALYYLSKVEQPKTRDHSQCNNDVCSATQYDMSGRTAVHRCLGRDCGMLGVDDEAMKAAFDDGHIGLLDIRGEHDPPTMNIDVVSSQHQPTYIALSHVWADGLGNPAANALPRCQLAYVASIMRQLEIEAGGERLLLWLDTLCCPVTSPRHRQRCLLAMRQIYKNARHVLILDAQLGTFNAADLESVEICARLIFSGWMRRLWTLQEGALAQKLWIQLKDRVIDLDRVERDVDHIYRTRFIHNQLALILVSGLKRLRNFGYNGRSRHTPDVVDLKMALPSRSVSVPSDEALCLCTCMNLDQRAVVEAAVDDRMAMFWNTMLTADRTVPNSILFFTGPRLRRRGLRWAPSSFLGSVEFLALSRPKVSDEVAKVTSNGLSVQLPGWECSIDDQFANSDQRIWDVILGDMRKYLFVHGADGVWYMIYPSRGRQDADNVSLRDFVRPAEGPTVFLQNVAVEDMGTDRKHSAVAQALVGTIGSENDDQMLFHSKILVNVLQVTVDLAHTWDVAARYSRSRDALEVAKSLHKDSTEMSIVPENRYLSRMPNTSVQQLCQVAQTALDEDLDFLPELDRHQVDGVPGPAVQTLAEWMLFFLAGRSGELKHTWPRTQKWCVD